MIYNDAYYAVERSDDYLAHWGVLGMKWGRCKNRNQKKKTNWKKELGYAAKSAALSTIMGPAAVSYMNFRRIANDDYDEYMPSKQKKKKKRR